MTYRIRNSERRLLQEVAEYIRAHVQQRLPVADLACRAEMHPLKFRNCFKQLFGLSPSDFINEARMQAAKQLLSTTNLPIKEIAARTGYRNVKGFHRAFKNHHGCTPGSVQ